MSVVQCSDNENLFIFVKFGRITNEPDIICFKKYYTWMSTKEPRHHFSLSGHTLTSSLGVMFPNYLRIESLKNQDLNISSYQSEMYLCLT